MMHKNRVTRSMSYICENVIKHIINSYIIYQKLVNYNHKHQDNAMNRP